MTGGEKERGRREGGEGGGQGGVQREGRRLPPEGRTRIV